MVGPVRVNFQSHPPASIGSQSNAGPWLLIPRLGAPHMQRPQSAASAASAGGVSLGLASSNSADVDLHAIELDSGEVVRVLTALPLHLATIDVRQRPDTSDRVATVQWLEAFLARSTHSHGIVQRRGRWEARLHLSKRAVYLGRYTSRAAAVSAVAHALAPKQTPAAPEAHRAPRPTSLAPPGTVRLLLKPPSPQHFTGLLWECTQDTGSVLWALTLPWQDSLQALILTGQGDSAEGCQVLGLWSAAQTLGAPLAHAAVTQGGVWEVRLAETKAGPAPSPPAPAMRSHSLPGTPQLSSLPVFGGGAAHRPSSATATSPPRRAMSQGGLLLTLQVRGGGLVGAHTPLSASGTPLATPTPHPQALPLLREQQRDPGRHALILAGEEGAAAPPSPGAPSASSPPPDHRMQPGAGRTGGRSTPRFSGTGAAPSTPPKCARRQGPSKGSWVVACTTPPVVDYSDAAQRLTTAMAAKGLRTQGDCRVLACVGVAPPMGFLAALPAALLLLRKEREMARAGPAQAWRRPGSTARLPGGRARLGEAAGRGASVAAEQRGARQHSLPGAVEASPPK